MTCTPPTGVAAAPVEGPFAIGEFVGPFEITAMRGVGGMGIVYEARDLVLGRRVAIKAARGQAGAELQNEARALAAVRHASLVTVYSLGSHRGVDYMAMELVNGQTLEAYLDALGRTPASVSIDEALDLVAAIADGLSALHGAGMAHRDLKPANVMLAGTRTVLIDLGLFVPEFEVSSENVIAGSPEYMAPEVLTRSVEPGGGPMIDLYALGMLAFEILTGRSPFRTATVPKLIARHISASAPDVRSLRPDVPARLAVLVAELCAKDPSDRPASSEAVVWQLSELRGRNLAGARPLRVLVLDDDPEVGAVLARTLEESFPGLHVERFEDPRAALRAIEATAPDLAVIDLNMPVMNGIEVCMRIDALAPERRPTILAMSAEATPRDASVLRALGAIDVVPKDYRFVARVADVVRTLRRAREESTRSHS